MLPPIRDYDALYAEFRWRIPARYNIGAHVCDRWAAHDPGKLALLHVGADGGTEEVTFGALRQTSNRIGNALAAHGVFRGDRVAILLPQCPAVAATHIGVYKLGAVALPLATLFGVEALAHRLKDSGAKALVTNSAGAAKVAAIAGRMRGRRVHGG